MRFKIKRCPQCKKYTLKSKCHSCNVTTYIAHPARFSPDDKYAIIKALVLKKLNKSITRYNLPKGGVD